MPSESETERRLRERRLIFYEDDVERINKALENYQSLSKSKCNILIDIEGHPVTQVGTTEGINLETISALVAASFAATKEVAKILGQNEFTTLNHQGKNESIQLTLVGERTILATIYDLQSTTPGMVMFYTKELVDKLNVVFKDISSRKHTGVDLGAGFEDMAKDVLDDMFGDV